MSIQVISKPIFQRSMCVISSITNSNPAVVTTTTNHQYITGMIMRLNVPKGFGMQQVNQMQSVIDVTSATQFQIALDTTFMDKFLALLNIGTTDSSGNISGTISTNQVPFAIGQSFSIGTDICIITQATGSMYCSQGSGSFNISTGVYSITGAPALTPVFFNQVLYPLGQQYAQCTPVGEISSTLQAATQNVLGTGFYS